VNLEFTVSMIYINFYIIRYFINIKHKYIIYIKIEKILFFFMFIIYVYFLRTQYYCGGLLIYDYDNLYFIYTQDN